MTERSTADRLSDDEVQALKFAAHRQLTRWANNRDLQPHQRAQRAALARAARVVGAHAFARGCELHELPCEENADV
jgi:hypothetical protein